MLSREEAAELFELWLAPKAPATRRAYRGDWARFARQIGAADGIDAARRLLAELDESSLRATARLERYAAALDGAGSSKNRRLSAITSLVRKANELDLVGRLLRAGRYADDPIRPTRGPGPGNVRTMLELASQAPPPAGPRDYAILRLLYDLALRRGEVAGLERQHIQLEADPPAVHVLGKRRGRREWRTLPPPTEKALRTYLAQRGDGGGPLFRPLTGSGAGLKANSIGELVKRYGAKADVYCTPHMLRHEAITGAARSGDFTIAELRQYSRHADERTLGRYVHAAGDSAGRISRKVAKGMDRRKPKRRRMRAGT